MAGGGRRPPGLLWGPRSHHPGKLGCPAKHGAPARDMSCYPSIHSCCGQGQRTREYSAVRCYRSLAEGQMLEWPSQGLQRIGTVMKQGKVSRPPPSAAQTGVGVTQVRGAYWLHLQNSDDTAEPSASESSTEGFHSSWEESWRPVQGCPLKPGALPWAAAGWAGAWGGLQTSAALISLPVSLSPRELKCGALRVDLKKKKKKQLSRVVASARELQALEAWKWRDGGGPGVLSCSGPILDPGAGA